MLYTSCTTNGARTTATGSRTRCINVGGNVAEMCSKQGQKVRHLGCRRGVAGVAISTQNCDKSVQIRQICIFRPQFGHKMSTLRHLCDTSATPKVSKLKTACTKGYRRISWLIYPLRHLFIFSARIEKKVFLLS